MLLSREKSLCEKNQAIVVSRDKGAQVEHRATNPKRQFDLRHYRLDGGLIQQEKCCDYILINDSRKKAYLIDKKASADVIAEVIEKAKAEREKGIIVAINIMKKNKKFQKEQLMADGYEEIEMIYAD